MIYMAHSDVRVRAHERCRPPDQVNASSPKPRSIQICKDWRSVTSECECSTTIASVASSERVAASFPSSAAGDDETPRSGAGQPETRKQVPKDLDARLMVSNYPTPACQCPKVRFYGSIRGMEEFRGER